MTTKQYARLRLSAEREAGASLYRLTLEEDGVSRVVGSIHQLGDGRWDWVAALGDAPDMRRLGQAETVEDAREKQFDALCEIDPAKFQRLAA